MKKTVYDLEVINNTQIAPGIHTITFDWPNRPEIEPVQFARLGAKNQESKFSRPFSVSHIAGSHVGITIKDVGPNTREYIKSEIGDILKVHGPNGTPIIINKSAKHYILVAGGIGAAGLTLLAEKLREMNIKVSVYIGAINKNELLFVDYFKSIGCEVKTIIQRGNKRFVTELLEEKLLKDNDSSIVVACGSDGMYESISKIIKKYKNECWVLLEKIMGCGVGSCKGDPVFIKGKNGKIIDKYICIHGPAFKIDEIDMERTYPGIIEFPLPVSEKTDKPMRVVLKGQYNDLELEYPHVNGAGCLDVGTIEHEQVDISCLGALFTKVVTKKKRFGNFGPRIDEGNGAVFNSIGWANSGIKNFADNLLPRWLSFGIPVIPNIGGFSEDEYVEIARILREFDVAGWEINPSCFNVNKVVTDIGTSCDRSYRLINMVREVDPDIPLIVKLTTGTGNPVPVAKACMRGGADILSIGNTAEGAGINVWTRLPKLGKTTGGLSGSAIHPLILNNIIKVYQANLGLPIIGVGGCEKAEDGIEFIIGGADAIGIGTELLANPNIFPEMHDGSLDIVKYHGVNHIHDLKGSLQKYDIEKFHEE